MVRVTQVALINVLIEWTVEDCVASALLVVSAKLGIEFMVDDRGTSHWSMKFMRSFNL